MLTAADVATHEALGIPPDLQTRAGIERLTDREARERLTSRHTGDLAGIAYPNRHPITESLRTYRVRRDHPEMERGKPRDKYLSAYGDPRHLYFAPGVADLLKDVSVPAVFVEAEKSVLAVTAAASRSGRPTLAIGTGGIAGWRGRIGKVETASGHRVDERGPSTDFALVTWSGRAVVLLCDANVAGNPASLAERRRLAEYLVSLGARVSVAEVPVEVGVNGPDDYLGRHGDAALWALVDRAWPMQPASAADVLRLAGLETIKGLTLPELEERLRLVHASLQHSDALRRRTVRELLVGQLRAEKVNGAAALADAAIGRMDASDLSETDIVIDDVPWPEPVDGARLLDELVVTIVRYIVLPQRPAVVALALWIVLTYFDAVVTVLALLLVTSPTKRCGKTKTVEVVGALACRALPVSNITTAALYRAIDKFHPTLLLDEGDTFINENPELRGVINAGHTRHTARVIRCVGEDSEPMIFSTWCPKLIAMIGRPTDTLLDRSIVIALERKASSERVEPLRADTAHLVCRDLRRRIRRWADDHLEAMRLADPPMPSGLHDRALDNWRPLIAIADLAGGAWATEARAAASALTGVVGDDDPIAEELLIDLRSLFDDPETVFDDETRGRLSTARVVELLISLDSKPWATFNKKTGKPVTQHQVARLLRRFGVRPLKVKIEAKSTNCYRRADLESVWNRYGPSMQVGIAEPANDSGPALPSSGRNRSVDGSDLNNTNSSMNPATVPRFRPDSPPSLREKVRL